MHGLSFIRERSFGNNSQSAPDIDRSDHINSKEFRGVWPQQKVWHAPSDLPRVTISLSEEDHAKVVELADGMALSAYIRPLALGQTVRLPGGPPSVSINAKKILPEILGLLGRSRIANNLNQLTDKNNICAFEMNEFYELRLTKLISTLVKFGNCWSKPLGTK